MIKKYVMSSSTFKSVSPLTFKVAKLWTSPEGATQKFSIDLKVDFPPGEIDARSNLKSDLMLIKLKEEISAIITSATVDVGFTCTRCLKAFTQTVEIPSAEREFLVERPPRIDDLNDMFLIDMKDLTIDMTEMIRQEIILHFPFIPVCSRSCKGLCSHCGKDRNVRPCSCKTEDAGIQKPFKNLKRIIKESKQ